MIRHASSRYLAALRAPLWQSLAALVLGLLLAWPVPRAWMEATMWRHMLVQYPLWMLTGALALAALPPRWHAGAARWNAHGISGLVGVGVVLAVLMVPRVLDLALRDPAVEIDKCAALLFAGAALRASWGVAGLVVQGFFLGNVLPMMVVVGQLYIDSPLRLCNAYLQDDQARLGAWLVGVAAVLALVWLMQVAWWMVRREEAASSMGRITS
ncbi:MAG: hypothetical protein JSR19_05075 [Proteobacteria bacterium]|nr:hypothetical protein [Pseudomonadota bacterium]HQR03657.1 hypothetical protein [Rhodocyclaceae bacterium]